MESLSPDLAADDLGPRAPLDALDVAAVVTAFGLPAPTSARDLGGTYNLNVLLDTPAGAYVVRVYRPWVTAARLRSVQQARIALAAAGLPVPVPLATGAGETALILDRRPVEVDPFVPHTGAAATWDASAAALALLGPLHDALRAAPVAVVPPRVSNYGTPDELLRWLAVTEAVVRARAGVPGAGAALASCRDTRELVQAFAGWWQREASTLPRQPLHGDYGGGNVLVDGARIVAILDFDFLGVRERVFELAYTVYWLLARLEPGVGPADYPWPRVARLLALYNTATSHPLTAQEGAALPLEMARVPLYWIATAGYTPDPIGEIAAMSARLSVARWLLDHAPDVARLLLA